MLKHRIRVVVVLLVSMCVVLVLLKAIERQEPAPQKKSVLTAPTAEPERYTQDELMMIALTVSGECYDDKEQDKRSVCEVILNRVSDGHFGGSILEVLTRKNQFCGYWAQSRSISESDIRIAQETLDDWFANDCKALSEYLFFSVGNNRKNNFY